MNCWGRWSEEMQAKNHLVSIFDEQIILAWA
jgi:hypothetical protein